MSFGRRGVLELHTQLPADFATHCRRQRQDEGGAKGGVRRFAGELDFCAVHAGLAHDQATRRVENELSGRCIIHSDGPSCGARENLCLKIDVDVEHKVLE